MVCVPLVKKFFFLMLMLVSSYAFSGNHLKKANYYITKGVFALAENELSFAFTNGEPKDEVLRAYCEVYYLTSQYDNLLKKATEYKIFTKNSPDSIAHNLFYYLQMTKYYTAAIYGDSIVYYSRLMLSYYHKHKPGNSFLDISMIYAQYMNAGRNSDMPDKYQYCDSVFHYYKKQYGNTKTYKLAKLHYMVGLMYLQRFELGKYFVNNVSKKTNQKHFRIAEREFKAAMQISKELGLYHSTLYAQPCSVLSLLYYYNEYPISKCLPIVDDAIKSLNPTEKACYYTGFNYSIYVGALNWKVNYHYKEYKLRNKIADLQKALEASKELLVLHRNYYSNSVLYDSYMDNYHNNPYSKISGLYYELYKKTGNINYKNRAFGYAEFLKRITTKQDTSKQYIIQKNDFVRFDSLLLGIKPINKKPKAYVNAIDTNLIDQYLSFTQKQLSKQDVLYYLSPVNIALNVTDLTIKWIITPNTIYDTLLSLGYWHSFPEEIFKFAQSNNISEYKRYAYELYSKLFNDVKGKLPNNISHLYISPSFRHKILNYEILITDSNGNSFKNLNYLFYKYNIIHIRNTTFLEKKSTYVISKRNPISIFAPVYSGKQSSKLPYSQSMASTLSQMPYIKTSLNGIDNADVFHYSGHISASKGMTNLSNFVTDNSEISAQEFFSNKSVGLVILQGCESASGRHMINMSQEGIVKQLFNLNVKTVISTFWPIDDQSSSLIMLELYQNLLHQKDMSIALREAKQRIFNKGYFNPIYWLGIYYEGAPAEIIIEEETNTWIWWSGGITFGFILLLFVRVYIR